MYIENSEIKRKDLDQLFNCFLKMYETSKKSGLYYVKIDKKQIDNETLFEFIDYGLQLIHDGVNPLIIEVRLEHKIHIAINNFSLNEKTLYLLLVAKKLILYFQLGEMDKFSYMMTASVSREKVLLYKDKLEKIKNM